MDSILSVPSLSTSSGLTLSSRLFPVAMIRHPDKKQLGEETFTSAHKSKLQSIFVGKSGGEPQTAGHVLSSVKNREK